MILYNGYYNERLNSSLTDFCISALYTFFLNINKYIDFVVQIFDHGFCVPLKLSCSFSLIMRVKVTAIV